jgi:6-phosphogluconolactonase
VSAAEIVVAGPEATEWAERAANWIATMTEQALQARGRVTLALSGGSTPAPVYRLLAELVPEWGAVELFFCDERCVPPDHEDSSYRLVCESLLERIPGAAPRIHRMRGELDDRDAAARDYEALLPEALDLVILGLGEDGHTASLFPGHAALDETTRRVLHVVGPKPPPDRLTLTPPAVRAARRSVVLARGTGKAEIVGRALEGSLDPRSLPVQLVRDGAWILDTAAAAALTRSSHERA